MKSNKHMQSWNLKNYKLLYDSRIWKAGRVGNLSLKLIAYKHINFCVR